MRCWKTFNIKKQYGWDRIFFLSAIVCFCVFSTSYVLVGSLSERGPASGRFTLFLLTLLAIYPLHKFLHLLPVLRYRRHLRFFRSRLAGCIPLVNVRIHEPVPKGRFLASLLLPFVLLNGLLLYGALLQPAYGHYYSLLLAYHAGLCCIDLLSTYHLLASPGNAFVEETESGYEILIQSIR